MAFSATIQNLSYEGAGVRKLYGTWSGAAGDAAGTMTIAGDLRHAVFQKRDALDLTYSIPRIEASTSNGICTLTIENQDNVTNGVFEITMFGG